MTNRIQISPTRIVDMDAIVSVERTPDNDGTWVKWASGDIENISDATKSAQLVFDVFSERAAQ